PEFPGGMAACLQHLARNIKYPTTAQKEGTQGKVIVQMVIEKDGSVDHVSIVRSISPELDAEAARVVKSMPKWKPATVKDKTVRFHPKNIFHNISSFPQCASALAPHYASQSASQHFQPSL